MADEGNWPLPRDWTGSFAAVCHSRDAESVVLCNDVIGFEPLYYRRLHGGLLGGNSLILLSRCVDSTADLTGVAQRITPPYANYGRRTILSSVARVLPGEWLRVAIEPFRMWSKFDNTLCDGLLDADVDTVARVVWDQLGQEISQAAGFSERISVAMSGGWDSRLVLAGLASRAETVTCLTYGNADAYESGVARRCAKAVGARFESFTIEENYFPPRQAFEELAWETEALNMPDWCGMIADLRERADGNAVILVGDHCQAVDGRYMLGLASRSARRKSFLDSLLGRRESFQATSIPGFERWREEQTNQTVSDVLAHLSRVAPELTNSAVAARVAEETAADVALLMERVLSNLPAFVPVFDELFAWYTKTRCTLASQNLLLQSVGRAYSPTMSLRALRLLTRVHPRLRIRRRLMDAIARLPEFDALARVPSAQIPFLGARSPALIRELTWGLRSGIDQALIRRVLRTGDPHKRQRVLRSFDFLREYRREGVPETVRSWFAGGWLRPERYEELARARASLASWPLINLDIVAPANVAVILDLCGVDRNCGGESSGAST
jgi:hypothetical protein